MSDIDILVAGSDDAVIMVEGGAGEVEESVILEAIDVAHESIKNLIDLQRELLEAEGVEVSERGCVDLKRFGWDGLPWHEIEELMRVLEEEV